MEAIKLDNNWSITPDTYSWKLHLSEERIKDEVVMEGKKKVKTGKQVPFIFEDDWYFPTVKQCLDKYLEEVFKADKTVSEIANRLSEIESKVDQLTGTFKKAS